MDPKKTSSLLQKPEFTITSSGSEWRFNGLLHKESGPAVEHKNGTKEWWQNGELHRIDGPAIERANGDKYWYIDGQEITLFE